MWVTVWRAAPYKYIYILIYRDRTLSRLVAEDVEGLDKLGLYCCRAHTISWTGCSSWCPKPICLPAAGAAVLLDGMQHDGMLLGCNPQPPLLHVEQLQLSGSLPVQLVMERFLMFVINYVHLELGFICRWQTLHEKDEGSLRALSDFHKQEFSYHLAKSSLGASGNVTLWDRVVHQKHTQRFCSYMASFCVVHIWC